MDDLKRTYLVSYTGHGLSGRFFHQRDTDDEPTIAQIESMEAKIAKQNGISHIAVIAIVRIGDSPKLES